MQSFQTEQYSGQSSICFLMIDKNPSDLTCIYSMLSFICKESQRSGVILSITFDQPLQWKALTMVHWKLQDSPIKRIVLLLRVILISHAKEFSQMHFIYLIIYSSRAFLKTFMPLIQQNTFYGKIYVKSCARTYHCRLYFVTLLLSNILGLSMKKKLELGISKTMISLIKPELKGGYRHTHESNIWRGTRSSTLSQVASWKCRVGRNSTNY